jgi:putative oxidoreductase
MTTSAGVILLVGRVLFLAFFLTSAYGHFKNHAMMTAYAKQTGIPVPVVAGWPSGVWLVAGAVSVAAGIWADIGVLMLGAIAVPTGVLLHAFWKIEDPGQRQTEKASFARNVSFVGAALALFAVFASIDHGMRYAVTGSLIHLT